MNEFHSNSEERKMKRISVVLGSKSDIEIYKKIDSVFKEFNLPFEKRIISAHRAPNMLRKYIEDAEGRGIKIFIAVAGMSAALPGVIASYTTLPVIGVPVALSCLTMGFDSLLSIVQMPPGVPVATVALNGGKNAALLAIEILAVSDDELSERLKLYKSKLQEDVIEQNKEMEVYE